MKSRVDHLSKMPPAMIAILCFAYFVIAVTALYFLNPDYSLSRSVTGNYDLGSVEFLIASTFFSLGLGSLALAIGLYQGMAPSTRTWSGPFLVSMWGLGMLIAGVFPANEGGSTLPRMATVLLAGIFPFEVVAYPETTFSFIHIWALVLSLPILSLGAILLWRYFQQDGNWRPIHWMVEILTVGMCIASILFFSTMLFPRFLGHIYTSYGPPLFLMIGLLLGLLWLLLVTVRLNFVFNRTLPK